MVEVVMVELLDERTDLVPLAAAELHLADGGRGDERSGEERRGHPSQPSVTIELSRDSRVNADGVLGPGSGKSFAIELSTSSRSVLALVRAHREAAADGGRGRTPSS